MFRIVYTREARFLRRFYKDGTRTLARNAGFNQEDEEVFTRWTLLVVLRLLELKRRNNPPPSPPPPPPPPPPPISKLPPP